MSNKIFLEVDRSITQNNLLIKDDGVQFATPNEELERLFPVHEASKIINLTPGQCLKLRDAEENKIFVNLCTANEIPEAPSIDDIELAAILDSEDPSKFRVPMCLGEPRLESDKAGEACKTFDVAINPKTFDLVQSSELFRQFLFTATLEGLQSKYNIEFNITDVNVLSKRKSMGVPRPQRMRAGTSPASVPLITEICPTRAQDLKCTMRVPKYRIRGEPNSGVDLKYMITDVSLPDVKSATEIEVDVGEDRIVVVATKSRYKLDVYLPHLIQQDFAVAKFNRDSRVLTLILPVKEVLNSTKLDRHFPDLPDDLGICFD